MKKWPLLIAVLSCFVLLWSCSGEPEGEPEEEDLCEGVYCSGHGSCRVSDGDVVCDCKPTFEAVGLECILQCDGGVDEDGVCDYWVLPAGSTQWEGYSFNPESNDENAPTRPVYAAFAFEDFGVAFVVTRQGFHPFFPETQEWGPTKAYSEYDPAFSADEEIRWALTERFDPREDADDPEPIFGSYIETGAGEISRQWWRRYNPTTNEFETMYFGEFHVDNPFEIEQEFRENRPVIEETRAFWMGPPRDEWVEFNICLFPSEIYRVYLTATDVFLRDSGECWNFADSKIPLDEWGPFVPGVYEGVPPMELIGGAFLYQEDLVLFRGE